MYSFVKNSSKKDELRVYGWENKSSININKNYLYEKQDGKCNFFSLL